MKSQIQTSILALTLMVGILQPLPAQDAKQEKVSIEWTFNKGDVFEHSWSQDIEVDIGGMQMSQTIVMKGTDTIAEVDDQGVASLQRTIRRVLFEVTGMMEIAFDSEKDQEAGDPLSELWGKMVGKSYMIKMNKRGEIQKVEGYKKIVDTIFEDLDDADPQTMMMKEQLTDEALQSMLQQSSALLPPTSVAVGETWKKTSELYFPNVGAFVLENEGTLKELNNEGQTAILNLKTSNKETEEKEGDEEEDEIPMATLVEFSTEATVQWNRKEGFPSSFKNKGRAVLDAMGQEVEVGLTMEITLTKKQ